MPKSVWFSLSRHLQRSVAIVLIVGGLLFSLLGFGGGAIAASLNFPSLILDSAVPLDLNQAADTAERASDDIYNGLERTKRDIGKTEGRKEVIQKARDHASDKWQSLANKTREAQESDGELSPVDQHTLQHLNDPHPSQTQDS